jgi:predicted RNA-binding Zn ribbon-like protein
MAAPDDLELLREFVNTKDPDDHSDAIDQPDKLAGWLSEHELISRHAPVSIGDVETARRLRESLRSLTRLNCGCESGDAAAETINEISEMVTLRISLDEAGAAQLAPTDDGTPGVFARLLGIMYTAMIDGTWWRLKGCANDTCRWVYYDQSKNRSRRWCDTETCGNVMNARAYRERQRLHRPG